MGAQQPPNGPDVAACGQVVHCGLSLLAVLPVLLIFTPLKCVVSLWLR